MPDRSRWTPHGIAHRAERSAADHILLVLIVIVIVRTFGEHEQIFMAVPRAVAYPGCRFSKMGLSFEPPRKPGLFVATHAIVAPDTRPKLFQRR